MEGYVAEDNKPDSRKPQNEDYRRSYTHERPKPTTQPPTDRKPTDKPSKK